MNRNWQLLVLVTLITPASRCLTAEQPPDEQRSVKVQSERVVIPISVAEASRPSPSVARNHSWRVADPPPRFL